MGRDKAQLTVDGERLVDRVVRLAATVATEVVVAGGTRGLAVSGARVVADAGGGPLTGIAAGLAACAADDAAVLAVDQPDPCPGLLVELAALRGGAACAAPVVEGRLQPLHAVWARSALPAVRDALAAGERSPTRLLDRLEVVRAGPEVWTRFDPGGVFAVGWNRPEDLDARGGHG